LDDERGTSGLDEDDEDEGEAAGLWAMSQNIEEVRSDLKEGVGELFDGLLETAADDTYSRAAAANRRPLRVCGPRAHACLTRSVPVTPHGGSVAVHAAV
jgi:hypothetical protein